MKQDKIKYWTNDQYRTYYSQRMERVAKLVEWKNSSYHIQLESTDPCHDCTLVLGGIYTR